MKPMMMLLLCALLCAPACLPPVTCTPGVMRCDDDTPMTCSSTGREWAVSSPRVRCAEVGGVCAVRDTIAACVRPDAAPVQPADAGLGVEELPAAPARADGGA